MPEPATVEVDLDDPGMTGYWSGRLGISKRELQAAVSLLGPRVCDLQRYFQSLEATDRECKLSVSH